MGAGARQFKDEHVILDRVNQQPVVSAFGVKGACKSGSSSCGKRILPSAAVEYGIIRDMTLRLYHGSQNGHVKPQYGLGEERHDFGKGFYLTDSPALAKEWAVSRPKSHDGWIHAFDLELDDLRVLDFRNEKNVFAWIAELMKHRDADESVAYRRRAPLFIERFGVDTDAADVIVGWRADASYFYIVKAFVRGEIDADCLPELLRLGGFGIQYVVKSQKAYAQLRAAADLRQPVRYDAYHAAYESRDGEARNKMRELIADPSFNRLERLFADLLRGERT